MSAKSKINPLNGQHTAGIFSDPSIDGPQIGTLVLVVDRAKNLPNRKTIGKQDPYCAARLGKEARKTATDIPGGQTPKCMFTGTKSYASSCTIPLTTTSSRSPSFSDDKKTELIGENWVDLRDIIVPGGGQSDQWETRNPRGKQAGELRMEITFYDSPGRPAGTPAGPASTASSQLAAPAMITAVSAAATVPTSSSSLSGPRARPLPEMTGPSRGVPKRRPLPSDPVVGHASHPPPEPAPQPAQQPVPVPQSAVAVAQLSDATQTPSRQLNPSAAYNTNQLSQPLGQYNTPPQPSPHQHQHQQQQPPLLLPQSQPAVSTLQMSPTRYQEYRDQGSYGSAITNGPVADSGYESTPSDGHQHQSYQRYQHHHAQSLDRYQAPSHYGSRDFGGDMRDQQPYDSRFDNAPIPVSAPPVSASYEETNMVAPVGDRPPPPPVHRSRNNSSGAVESGYRNSFNSSTVKGTPPQTIRHDVLRSEAHRHSISSAYPGRPIYRPVESGTSPTVSAAVSPVDRSTYGSAVTDPFYQPSPPRHRAYDSAYDAQPYSTEEANNGVGPLVPASFQQNTSRQPPQQPQQQSGYEYSEPDYNHNKAPSPSPLSLASHRGASPAAAAASGYAPSTPTHYRNGESMSFAGSVSPSPMQQRDNRTSPAPPPGSGYSAYDAPAAEERYQGYHSDLDGAPHEDDMGVDSFEVMPVPASLVPGVDPGLALELRSRIHQEDRRSEQRRYTIQQQPMDIPARGRQMTARASSFGQEDAARMYTAPQGSYNEGGYGGRTYDAPPQARSRYERSPGPYSSGAASPAPPVPAAHSPNPRHTIKRKSVSPAPPPAPASGTESRRLSGIPFGPDSYDELNPTVAATIDPTRSDFNEATGKIVSYDGREIDPSDHLPMNTWAPEPEAKPTKPTGAAGTLSSEGAVPSGRRQLRIAGRPQAAANNTGITFSSGNNAPVAPASRNRLQKKTSRQSPPTVPTVSSSSSGGGNMSMAMTISSQSQNASPLAPLSHPRQQDNFTPPRGLPRANTYDGASENHAPAMALYGGSPGRSGFGAPAPPVPAKVPMGSGSIAGYGGGGHRGIGSSERDRSPAMSGALPMPIPESRALPWEPYSAGPSGEVALMEEMSRIDLGSGRARRHHGRQY
ncbi:conserved serine-proline-rich protein [Grosmannia clavigera kw1407]|uniref:Conserved serine-proline-rich protein n=1 Tax=Grosmannia clavigera (strain kw1407 / UAMH 11150) TaxID=655863 RepID=F0XHB1_GROCL|nr:conserved serine-proline-rich protein [Grosmannia clavigera kw1407]EFX03116.1 conserved serine-proline-rich protein [Grosmannia clavigera kw1407]